MFYTGLDPFTGQEVHNARQLRERKVQRALLPFFKPENSFELRKAPWKAGRQVLIGSGCDALFPAQPQGSPSHATLGPLQPASEPHAPLA